MIKRFLLGMYPDVGFIRTYFWYFKYLTQVRIQLEKCLQICDDIKGRSLFLVNSPTWLEHAFF